MNKEKTNKLDRKLQKKLLLQMRDVYPDCLEYREDHPDKRNPEIIFNLAYLEEHGLCTDAIRYPEIETWSPRITAKGIDFLEEDGGLQSILGIVTVRLEADTLRQLIEKRITDSDKTEDEKSKIKHLLTTIPDKALSASVNSLFSQAFPHLPYENIVEWLRALSGL
ncbi:hypothetical protein FAI40_01740 [Acetobacteraceae bacterium]|nr:hypothetical protein FAI40_01740 [Acetobacteraceae bacterium]